MSSDHTDKELLLFGCETFQGRVICHGAAAEPRHAVWLLSSAQCCIPVMLQPQIGEGRKLGLVFGLGPHLCCFGSRFKHLWHEKKSE